MSLRMRSAHGVCAWGLRMRPRMRPRMSLRMGSAHRACTEAAAERSLGETPESRQPRRAGAQRPVVGVGRLLALRIALASAVELSSVRLLSCAVIVVCTCTIVPRTSF